MSIIRKCDRCGSTAVVGLDIFNKVLDIPVDSPHSSDGNKIDSPFGVTIFISADHDLCLPCTVGAITAIATGGLGVDNTVEFWKQVTVAAKVPS